MPHDAASSSTVKAEGKLPYIRPTPRIIGGSLVRAAANAVRARLCNHLRGAPSLTAPACAALQVNDYNYKFVVRLMETGTPPTPSRHQGSSQI